jgi:cell division protein ZapE
MQDVHLELHQRRISGADRTTAAVARDLAKTVRFLAFDEFQITNISDALIVETLFDSLFANGVVVVMTSNRPPEDLYKGGLNRHLAIPQFLALLHRHGITEHGLVPARDFRAPVDALASSVKTSSDFISRDVTADSEVAAREVYAQLRSAFANASGSNNGEPATVPIAWGRSMLVTEAAGGVGFFTFEEICGAELNADDYNQLVNKFHTFVVAGVPRFSLKQHNEARRFTNLVDCLYEHHSRLVVSADAPLPEFLAEMERLAAGSLTMPVGAELDRRDPFSPELTSTSDVLMAASSAGASSSGRSGAGDDDTSTGSNVAGVLAGAVGSLHESGFAAKRAASRLLHMQSDEYLRAHQRHCRAN